MEAVKEVQISASRRILEYCLDRVLEEVRAGKWTNAGHILTLVHNLPLHGGSKDWDVDFFLKAWLPAFIDHYDEIPSGRDIVRFVCTEIASSPELRTGKW